MGAGCYSLEEAEHSLVGAGCYSLEEAEHSLVGAGCYSLEEGSAASAAWPTSELWSRTSGFPDQGQSALFSANDDGSTGNMHNNSKPRWK